MVKKCGKLLRRAFACLLVVVMTLTAVPMSGFVGLELPKWSEWFATKASAAEGELKEGYYTYTVSDGKATINHVDKSISGNIAIPSTLGGYPVTSIGNYAFEDCDSLTSVTIGDSVTSIGDYAFKSCDSLTSITIPDSVTSIGNSAFESCYSLTSITVDSANKYYSDDGYGVLFNKDKTTLIQYPIGNSRSSYSIPDSVTSIGNYAFEYCDILTSITIPDSVTSIGNYAFDLCYNLKDVYYNGTEEQWKAISIGSNNECLNNATIHFAYNSQNSSATSRSNRPLKADSLLITPYTHDSGALFGSDAENAIVDWGTSSATTTKKNPGVYVPKNEINGQIKITEANHRDYIIPATVANDFSKLKAAASFPVHMTRKDSESRYISSVIGKKSTASASKWADLKYVSLECTEGEKATIYVTSCGLSNPTYYISQDNAKKIPSTTGEFSAVDVYNEFDFGEDIVVYAVDSNGTKTQPVKIKLSKRIKLSNSVQALEKMTTMNLLGSNGLGFKISDDFPILGGTSIDFSAFKVPVGVEIDGTDVKLSLGFDFFESKKNYDKDAWENEWKGFKDNCKSTEKVINGLSDSYKNWKKKWNSLENLKKQYSGKNIIKTGAADKDKGWTCSVLGYIEGKLTEDGKICFKEGSIMASAEFKFKYSQQTAVWVIPAYYYFELGANVSLDGKVYKLVPDRSCPVDWAVTLGVEPKVAVGGGAGIVDFASVGLRGEGSVPIKLEFRKGHLTIDLKGAIYAEGQILFIKGKKKIIDGKMNILDKNLWGTKKAKQILSLRREAAAYNATASETVVTVMDRDYAENTSSWLGSSSGVRRAPAKAAASGGIRFTNLQTSVYNQSQPQVVTVGDKQIMVYVADDSTRDDYNRLCLMYSVNENGTWSTPKAVYSDGKNDASPSLATDGKKVYVSWQKVAKKLTAADCESEQVMLQNMEIYLAEFNAETGSFENAKRLTNNSVYDYLPFTVVENEKASVYYAEGDPAGYTNKIVRYSGGSTATLKSSLPYVSALSAVSDAVSYSIDTDVTNGLTNDMTVYTVKDGHVSEFEKYVSEEADTTENAYNLLTYGELDGKQTLFVSDGSSVYYQKDGKTQKAFSAVSSISGYLQAVKTDTGLTLLWLGYTDDSTEIFSCSYENGAWSEPVQVSSQGNIISFLSANYAGGTIRGVCNITENQFNESAGDYDIGQTNLTSFVIGDFTDLSVSAFAPDETELKPGAETVINGYVTQKGTQDISSLDITVTDTLGTNVNYQQDVELKSGSTINLEIPYTVPQDYKGTTITVRVNTDNTDKDENDNTVALETGKNTILLNDRPIEEFDDVYILPLSVENYTALDIENLTLTYSIENYDENTENESVTLKLDSLTEDSYNDVRIAVKKDGLVYDEDGFARINIAVYDGEDELSSLVSVIENPDRECRHAETEEIAGVAATCSEKGKTAAVKCSICEEILSGGEEVPALGHAVVVDKAVAATCTKTGLTEGKHCSRCKAVLVARKTVAKKAHTYKTTVTPATTSKDGKAVAACTVCKAVAKTVVIPKVSYFKLSASAYVCDGKAKTPTVTVKDSKGKTLKNGTDYTLAYSSGRKDIGRYAVKVTLKGYYSGSKILYFDIIPAQVSRPKAKQSTSAIALSWSKVAGSNIRYYVFSYNPGTKKYTCLGYTTGTSYTVKKLSSGTTYYYAVQAYNTTAKKWGKVSPVLTTATKPGTPTLKAVAGTRKATLSWNRQNGVTGYLLYMATSKNGKYTKIATLKGNTKVSYTKTGLTKGRYYYFKVIAYKTVGSTNLYGAYSSVRYVKVK